MNRKSCIVETTVADAPLIQAHLPAGIRVAGELASADGTHLQLRLEGEGLPEWCYVAHGAYLMHGVLEVSDDGTIRLIPGSGLPVKQVPAKFEQEIPGT